jgi:transposase InsO family protein
MRLQAFAKACRVLGLRHIRTKPYTITINGKAERYGLRPTASTSSPGERNRWLPRYLGIYNRLRKHFALGWRSTQQRLVELLG